MSEVLKDDFCFWYPAEIKKGEDGKMWISGIASTEHEDLQGERIKQDGLELSYFLKRGYFNDDHAKETGAKVGIPTEAVVTKQGLWVKGYLLTTERAKSIYELATALNKADSERKLGFSVEGKVLGRDSKNPRIITKAWIKDVAITASPINPNTFLDIAKSFASKDCTTVFVANDDIVEKGKKEPKQDVVDALEDATKTPVVEQAKVEEKDAEETAKQALSEKKPKQDMEKQLNDVPIAKRAFKSLEGVEIVEDADGNIIIKGLKKLKLAEAKPPVVEEIPEGEPEVDAHDHVERTAEKQQGPTKEGKHFKEGRTVSKSVEDGDLEKGFNKIHEMGGEREIGDKKVPIHVTQYKHKKHPHHIIVTGKDDAYAVNHAIEDKDGSLEYIAGHLFHDDSEKGKKAKDDCEEHLKGYGIKHRFLDKKRMMHKAIVTANDESNSCESCNNEIKKGVLFVIQEGHSFCGEDCIEKALVSGYCFGKTDQVGGAALRVESLEGSQKHQEWGTSELTTKVKDVKFDTGRANGGTTQVTLKDAMDYLTQRGLSEDIADRVLVLMVKNEGDISRLLPGRK
jgi:hypothetical protein